MYVPKTEFSEWGCQLEETAKEILACRKQKVNGKNKDWSAWSGGSCQSPESFRKIKACEKEGRGTYVGKKEQCKCKRGYVWPKVKKPEDHGCQTKESAQKLEEKEIVGNIPHGGGSLGRQCTNNNDCDASTENVVMANASLKVFAHLITQADVHKDKFLLPEKEIIKIPARVRRVRRKLIVTPHISTLHKLVALLQRHIRKYRIVKIDTMVTG